MEWEVVSFDCYGTLVDWEAGIVGAFLDAAGPDVDLDPADVVSAYHEIEPRVEADGYRSYREVLTETGRQVARLLGLSRAAERDGFLVESLPEWPVFPDTTGALRRLKTRFRIAILSNVDDDLLGRTIDRIGVDFDWTVTAEQVRSYKPAAGHFEEAIRRMDGAKHRLLHAAQSYFHDVRPARQLDLSVVWVNRKGEPQPAGPEPTHVVGTVAELADWLGV